MRAATVGLIVLGLTFPACLQAQNASGPARFGVIAGAGFGTHFVPHASLALNHRTGDYILRGSLGYGPSLGDSGPWGGPKEFAELALLYGLPKRWSRVRARAALGIGYVDGAQLNPVGPGEEPVTSAAGLATQGSVVWVLHPRLGLGVTGLGNLNRFNSFGALTLSLHLGGAWAGVSDRAEVAMHRPRPRTVQDPGGGLSWRRGLLIGALSGGALGVLAHLAINSVPCDTCEDGNSSAEGTFPEFVLGFSVGGALIGALIGTVF